MGNNRFNYLGITLELKMDKSNKIQNKLKKLQDEVQQFIFSFDEIYSEPISRDKDRKIGMLVTKLEILLNNSKYGTKTTIRANL